MEYHGDYSIILVTFERTIPSAFPLCHRVSVGFADCFYKLYNFCNTEELINQPTVLNMLLSFETISKCKGNTLCILKGS